MSLTTVEIKSFAGPESVEIIVADQPDLVQISRLDQPEVIYINQGPAGAAGPNSVTSATTSNGTANLTVNSESFNLAPTGTATAGRLQWNDADGTLDLGLKGGNVTLQVGQEQLIRVVNKTSPLIDLLEANFQVVRITGAQGQRLKVDLAKADSDLNSGAAIGVVTETILKNQEGFITTSGLVRGIDTRGTAFGESWADGDVLYLSPTVFGRLTKVKPIAPQHLVNIGWVVNASVNGSIFIKVDNGYELQELHNVQINAAGNPLSVDDILVCYDSTSNSGYWKNTPLSGVAVDLISNQTIDGEKTFIANTNLNGDTVIGTTSILQHVDYNWNIQPDGAATFNSVTVNTINPLSGDLNISGDVRVTYGGIIADGGTFVISGGAASSYGLFRGDFIASLIVPETLTTDQTYTLPDATGTVALTSGTQTFSGAQAFSGQVELTGQAATNATSAMTRDLVAFESFSNFSNWVDFRESIGATTTGGQIGTISGMGAFATVDTTAAASARNRMGILRASSGGTMTYSNALAVSILFDALNLSSTASNASLRLRIGYHGPNLNEPNADGDPLLANTRGIGVEFSRNTVNNLLRARIFARNGTNSVAGTFISSAWVDLTGYTCNDSNRNSICLITHSGGSSPTIKFYFSSFATTASIPRMPTTPLLTLTGTGIPNDQVTMTSSNNGFILSAANQSTGTNGGGSIRVSHCRAQL